MRLEYVNQQRTMSTKKLRTPLPRGSSLCEGMGEGYCTQSYPCICKEAVSGFEPMTNKSPKGQILRLTNNYRDVNIKSKQQKSDILVLFIASDN